MGQMASSFGAHDPWPYVVRLRVALDDDSRSGLSEWRGYAYSVIEAMLQASISVSGSADTANIKVESVDPDLDEYGRMITAVLAARVDASR